MHKLHLTGQGLFLHYSKREIKWVDSYMRDLRTVRDVVCSYMGHAYLKLQGVDVLIVNKGCQSEGCNSGTSLRKRLIIHQKAAISSTDQGSSDEEVCLIEIHH